MSGTTSEAYYQQWSTIRGATCISDALFSPTPHCHDSPSWLLQHQVTQQHKETQQMKDKLEDDNTRTVWETCVEVACQGPNMPLVDIHPYHQVHHQNLLSTQALQRRLNYRHKSEVCFPIHRILLNHYCHHFRHQSYCLVWDNGIINQRVVAF